MSTSNAWLATNQPESRPGEVPVNVAPPSTSGGRLTTGATPGTN